MAISACTAPLWPQLAERLGIEADAGALVQDVGARLARRGRGLDPGDETIDFRASPTSRRTATIVAVDAEPLTRTQDLSDVIGRHGEGDEVVLTVVRRRAPPGADHARTASAGKWPLTRTPMRVFAGIRVG